MTDEYSLYDAKAKLSALVRRVRDGHTIVITVHGERVAELRPIDKQARPQTLDERIAELMARGLIGPAKHKPSDPAVLRVGKRKPGALKRFLEDRE